MTDGASKGAREGANYASEIVATGYAYPSDLVDNDAYLERCQFHVTDDVPKLVAETRMETRHWCTDDENTWTLAQQAIDMAFKEQPSLKDDIDVVLVASATTMPVLHPPRADDPGMADLAPLVLQQLGRNTALGLDIKGCYCTGFLRGVQTMDSMLANSNYRAGLVVATEQGSRMATHETNRSKFCFIMADAAGAVVLKKRPKETKGIVDYVGRTDASKFEWVGIGGDGLSTVMRGAKAGEATHHMLMECAQTLMQRNGVSASDIDWLLPLQTHAGIVDGLVGALEWPEDKLLWRGGRTGLSGSASIPAALSEYIHEGTIKKGQLVLSVAVGGGLNSGGMLYYI